MKVLIIALALLLQGCAATITITDDRCEITTARKVAVTCNGATVISGEVLLNQESVQVLGKQIPSVTGKEDK